MAEEKFEFGGQSFVYEKNETNWELKLKRSDVASQDLRELLLLDLHHPFFLEQSMVSDEDSVTFSYQVEAHGLTYEEIKERTISERIRLALNVFSSRGRLGVTCDFPFAPSKSLYYQGCSS